MTRPTPTDTPPTAKRTRAEINKENAQKSTGPRTEEGKNASRANALKHGLTATTIAPVEAPGEPPGAFQARLDDWVDDLKPRNVLEMAMVQRACRATWKLDRCARYEDAAAGLRHPPGGPDGLPDLREEARKLGTLLMFALEFEPDPDDPFPSPTLEQPPGEPDAFDDAERDAHALNQFKEGVEWLLNEWAALLPGLADPGAGAREYQRRVRARARRLLGVPTGAPDPSQPLLEAGEAEVRRLEARLAEFTGTALVRSLADLRLLGAWPDAPLLLRYEATAERELHRAVNTFLKLRQHPELLDHDPAPKPEPAPAPAPVAPEPPARPAPAAKASATPDRRRHPARNEPSDPKRSNPPTAPAAARKARRRRT